MHQQKVKLPTCLLHAPNLCMLLQADAHAEGPRLNEQLEHLGAKAGVLSKTAASNLRKLGASLAASAKELSAKASEQIKSGKVGSGQY